MGHPGVPQITPRSLLPSPTTGLHKLCTIFPGMKLKWKMNNFFYFTRLIFNVLMFHYSLILWRWVFSVKEFLALSARCTMSSPISRPWQRATGHLLSSCPRWTWHPVPTPIWGSGCSPHLLCCRVMTDTTPSWPSEKCVSDLCVVGEALCRH